ncbi:hypothetical protein OOT46_13635 [Aquabacterium sp. A7-Y]|uniref:hypothetical protein n=1 Tax=Aquabacterium sp. A7-Y TaxID=1349605 RepID=UPI00223E003B|nr:hypothetical protein [Aquabacterium sp. A7-Y]MCW7538882.1 hypothetical protein [Aquabacterium sp. A7-Y]
MSSHPLLLAAAQDDRTHDEELRFARTLAGHPLWITGQHSEPVNGKPRTRLSFMSYDGGTRLGLTAYVEEGAHLGDPGFAGGPVIACSGAILLSWTQQQKFDAVLSDGEHIAIVPYPQLCNLRTLLLLASGAHDAPQNLPPPRVDGFARAVYAYCESHAEVERCWLCLLVAPGVVSSVGVLLEAALGPAHEEQLERLSQLHLPAGVGLLHLAPGRRRPAPGQHELRAHPPFYDKARRPGRWDRLMRRLRRPQLPVLELEVPTGDAG